MPGVVSGKLLLYLGAGIMAVAAAAAVIAAVHFFHSRKRLKQHLTEEYGPEFQ